MEGYSHYSLSYSTGPISSSFSAKSLAMAHDLEWCHFHLATYNFQSAHFLTDSQSALTLLSTAQAFLQPKSFWDIWALSDSLRSSQLPVGLQSCWTP